MDDKNILKLILSEKVDSNATYIIIEYIHNYKYEQVIKQINLCRENNIFNFFWFDINIINPLLKKQASDYMINTKHIKHYFGE